MRESFSRRLADPMTLPFKQAPRVEGVDGVTGVERTRDTQAIRICVGYGGHDQILYMTEHTAAKLVVKLAFMIGLPIANRVLKAVKL